MTKCCNSGGFVGRGVSHDMNAANSERHQPLKYLFAFITPKRQCACHPERSPALFLSRPVAAGRARDAERDLLFSKFAENANPKGRGFGVWGNDRFSSGHGFSRAATPAKRERL
jgi:hypothetical protein